MTDKNRIWLKDNSKIIKAFEKDNENDNSTSIAIQKICFFANILYILFHLAYMIFFIITGRLEMVYLNIGSMAYFLLLFVLFKLNRYDVYVILTGLEIAFHMTFSTIFIGWDAGYHLCLIGLCILAFFTSYFSRKKHNVIRPLHWTIFLLADYIFLYFWCKNNKPYYPIDELSDAILNTAHLIIVFVVTSGFLFFFIRHISKLEKKIIRDSKTDELTQIGNRKALDAYFSELDFNKQEYTLTIFDIDDFKVINDEYGHLCGDYILRKLSNVCLLSKQDNDFVVRFGGEEFIIISTIDKDFKTTCEFLDSLRIKIENTDFFINDKSHKITVTMGISKYENNYTLEEWIKNADIKLYKGKSTGKNKIVY